MYILFIYLWLHPMVCETLVPQPRIELAIPSLEAQNLKHWTAGKS